MRLDVSYNSELCNSAIWLVVLWFVLGCSSSFAPTPTAAYTAEALTESPTTPISESLPLGSVQFAADPFQKALQSVSEEHLQNASRQAIEPFLQDDGSILIQPNIFIYLVATL